MNMIYSKLKGCLNVKQNICTKDIIKTGIKNAYNGNKNVKVYKMLREKMNISQLILTGKRPATGQ